MGWPFSLALWHGICMPGVISTQRATAGAVALPGRAQPPGLAACRARGSTQRENWGTADFGPAFAGGFGG